MEADKGHILEEENMGKRYERKKMKRIPIYIESKNGHDTLDVPENKVQGEVEKQLKDGKWVTTEKEGQTEILTKEDMPKSATTKTIDTSKVSKSQEEEWADKFKNIKSATATEKAKGG